MHLTYCVTIEKGIHLFVEILDRYFGNVCELDLVFNFHRVRLMFLLEHNYDSHMTGLHDAG